MKSQTHHQYNETNANRMFTWLLMTTSRALFPVRGLVSNLRGFNKQFVRKPCFD